MTPVWLTIKAAASRAMVSERTIRVWMHGGLEHTRISHNLVRIHVDDLDSYLSRYKRGSVDVDNQVQAAITKAKAVVRGMMR